MQEAITYLYEFYDQFVDFLFNDMEIVAGVTFGWVMIVIIIIGILLRNILAVPRSARSMPFRKREDDE